MKNYLIYYFEFRLFKIFQAIIINIKNYLLNILLKKFNKIIYLFSTDNDFR